MADKDEPLFSPTKAADQRKSSNGDVGYRRPPVEHQFKPGQSGNPRGRPRKTPYDIWNSEHAGILDIVRMVANEPVTIIKKGKSRQVRYIEGFIRQIASGGIKNPGLSKLFLHLVSAAEKATPPIEVYDFSQLTLREVEELKRLCEKAISSELRPK